jgi:GNAT superfamily N-acetyltransferase
VKEDAPMESTTYREMVDGEEEAVNALVEGVFNEFVAPDYDDEGIAEFFRFANPDAMKERIRSGGFVLVAEYGDRLAGVLEFTPPNSIAMLFVTVRRRGIAKGLLSQAMKKVLVANPSLSKLIVHSSPYAVAVYEKMGFHSTDKAMKENGIEYVPMELSLNGENA